MSANKNYDAMMEAKNYENIASIANSLKIIAAQLVKMNKEKK